MRWLAGVSCALNGLALLVNLVIGGISLVRGLPGLPSLLLRFIPERGNVPEFNRAWIATVLTAQVAAGAAMILAHPEVPTTSGKFVPGRHVTDRQMRLSMKLRSREIPTIAAARVGFSAAAAYRFEGDGCAFPFERKGVVGAALLGPVGRDL